MATVDTPENCRPGYDSGGPPATLSRVLYYVYLPTYFVTIEWYNIFFEIYKIFIN